MILWLDSTSMDSLNYWNTRYLEGGNSGAGSTGRLNSFKAEYLESVIQKYQIQSILDFGCGQGAILDFIKIDEFLGYDISSSVVEALKDKYRFDSKKTFTNALSELSPKDLVLSFDVIFHLVENSEYEEYIWQIFEFAKEFVLIYSSNSDRTDPEYATAPHVRHRIFLQDVPRNFQLIEMQKGKYPYDGDSPNTTSWSDFYLFKRYQ